MQYRTMRISVYSFIISAILLTASCSSINKKCKDITFGELSKDVQDTLQCVNQKVIEEDYSPKAMIDFSGKCKFIKPVEDKNNLIDLSIGWQLSAASLNSTIFNGLFYEKCNEI